MLLHDLIRRLNSLVDLAAVPNVQIQGIREDSRLVRAGDLFVARWDRQGLLPSGPVNPAHLLADAHARGAAAAVVAAAAPGCSLPQIVVDSPGAAGSVLANAFHGDPSHHLRVLGVTGTNGKTTVTYLLRHILGRINQRCGIVGTVEIDDGVTRREANMTTPGACDVAELLAAMRGNGCRACAIEVSSHALHQGRAAGVRFAGAAFTNLTGDHLDYHLTMEAYADAKAMLFASLDEGAVAAMNDDDPATERMVRDCRGRIMRWGFGRNADYRAEDPAYTGDASHFVLATPDGRTEVTLPLTGRHNVQNALAAATLASEVFGMSVHQIAAALRDVSGAPGRLQAVRVGQPFAVLVDYAHTDDALRNVLEALRQVTRGRLRVLFGCGGDRDRMKRPRMAGTAERLADDVYVTSDNPRTEDPAQIFADIIAGFASPDRHIIEPDRRAAIERILCDAQSDDVVLIAGKGHENYQIIGKEKRHFDDVEEASRVLRKVGAVA